MKHYIMKEAYKQYEKGGVASICDYANKKNIPYDYCKGCDCLMPVLNNECLACGQKIST